MALSFLRRFLTKEAPRKLLQNTEAAPKIKCKPAKHIICIGSGKGGVGKSTVSARIAMALSDKSSLNLNVGLVDADFFGPSLAKLMGVEGE